MGYKHRYNIIMVTTRPCRNQPSNQRTSATSTATAIPQTLLKKAEDYAVLKAQNASLTKRLSKMIDVEMLEKQVEDGKDANKQLKAELSEMKKRLAESQRENRGMVFEKRALEKLLDSANEKLAVADKNGKKRAHAIEIAKLKKEVEAEKALAAVTALEAKERAAIAQENAKTEAIAHRREHARRLATEKEDQKEAKKRKREEVAMGRLNSAFGNVHHNFPSASMMQLMQPMMHPQCRCNK